METRARHMFARVSPTKVRKVARLIAHMPLPKALDTLRVSPKRAARLLEKLVKSAWANAVELHGRLDEAAFSVTSARVDDGPRIKRWRAGDRGRMRRIIKRGCHITVVLSDQGKESGPES